MPTVGFNVTDEYKDHVKQLIANMGLEAEPGTWFKKAVSLMELQNIQEGSEFAEDLKEFEGHALRLYEIMDNIVKRGLYKRDEAVRKIQQDLDQKEAELLTAQVKLNGAEEAVKTARSEKAAIEKINEDLLRELNDVRKTNESHEESIKLYKGKVDELSGIITEYKGFKEENQRLKKEHEAQLQEVRAELISLNEANAELQQDLNDLNYQLKEKDVERDRALLQLERQYQSKLASAHEEYNETLKGLYEQINSLKDQNREQQRDFDAMLKEALEERKEEI
ncbi:hypothetical protein ACSU6B_23065 [Neobacillus sp. C211]|uniref:hypothetical protein n=1 Tax=unclassified Neobacillus TaxID=2675272 RepID=UPI00397D4751